MQEDLCTLIRAAAGDIPVSWSGRPQGSPLPAVVLWVISEPTTYTFKGSDALITNRVQMDIYADDPLEALTIDRLIKPAIDGYAGAVGDTRFLGIFLLSRSDTAEPGAGSEPIARISRDLMVKHKEI